MISHRCPSLRCKKHFIYVKHSTCQIMNVLYSLLLSIRDTFFFSPRRKDHWRNLQTCICFLLFLWPYLNTTQENSYHSFRFWFKRKLNDWLFEALPVLTRGNKTASISIHRVIITFPIVSTNTSAWLSRDPQMAVFNPFIWIRHVFWGCGEAVVLSH